MRQTIDDPLKPNAEWIRPGDVRRSFGIGRASCYNLIRDGKLRSVCIRQPGRAFGMRLVNVESLRAYITASEKPSDDGKGRPPEYYSKIGVKGGKTRAANKRAAKKLERA